MRYWLMKTEPDVFSYDDLLRSPKQTTAWEGVRNYQARNFMRDTMRVGDLALIYHSSCAEPGLVGTAKVVRTAVPDLTALDPQSPYYDPKSAQLGQSRWCLVEVQAFERFSEIVSLQRIKAHPDLASMLVVQRGQRLSIQPVSEQEWKILSGLVERLSV